MWSKGNTPLISYLERRIKEQDHREYLDGVPRTDRESAGALPVTDYISLNAPRRPRNHSLLGLHFP